LVAIYTAYALVRIAAARASIRSKQSLDVPSGRC
jgi:DNA-directed RNA polymerase subunit K/omega